MVLTGSIQAVEEQTCLLVLLLFLKCLHRPLVVPSTLTTEKLLTGQPLVCCVCDSLSLPPLSLFSCLHRSWQGPVAFGCQNFVVVVEPHTAQRLQTLVHHKAHVTKASLTAIIYIVAAIVVSNTLVTGLLGTAGLSLYTGHTLHSAAGISGHEWTVYRVGCWYNHTDIRVLSGDTPLCGPAVAGH